MAQGPYDIVVIGAGPGGYVAAIRAAQLGFKTAVVEREHLGGICLNWGCIPTKALLRSAELLDQLRRAADFGLGADNVRCDPAAVVKRSRQVSAKLNAGVAYLLKKNRVDVIWGEARIAKPGEVLVSKAAKAPAEPSDPAPRGVLGEGAYQARHIIVATGARPRVLPGLEPDGKQVLTYFEAMLPESVPKSLLVIGSGAIGIEFASFYRALGSAVTVVEVLPQILPLEDAEIAGLARKQLEKRGMTILSNAKVTGLDKSGDAIKATIADGNGGKKTVTAERVISAVGVVGNVEGLRLEALGVELDKGSIVTDGFGRTSVPGLYAIGDVAGGPMLAHKAEHEGVVCVEAIKGLKGHALDKGKIPACTYATPQIASVGLTEARAKEAGKSIKVGRFPFMGNGKAIALGEPEGLVKTIFDADSGQLLGAHMIGAEVTELIHGYVTAMVLETTEEQLMQTVFPHPTLSEAMHESVLAAFDRAIHV